jgi:hypothetical protein
METVLGIIKEYAWGFWMGFGLAMFFDVHFYSWKWWAYVIPLLTLIAIWRY